MPSSTHLGYQLVSAAGVSSHPTQLQLKLFVLDLVVDDVDDLGGFLDELGAGHLGGLELLNLCFGRLPRLADRAPVIALQQQHRPGNGSGQ